MPIGGIRNFKKRTSLRIKRGVEIQRQYNRFRKRLDDDFGIHIIFGFGGHTEIICHDFSVDVFKNEKYVHIIVHGEKAIRNEIVRIAYDMFGVIDALEKIKK